MENKDYYKKYLKYKVKYLELKFGGTRPRNTKNACERLNTQDKCLIPKKRLIKNPQEEVNSCKFENDKCLSNNLQIEENKAAELCKTLDIKNCYSLPYCVKSSFSTLSRSRGPLNTCVVESKRLKEYNNNLQEAAPRETCKFNKTQEDCLRKKTEVYDQNGNIIKYTNSCNWNNKCTFNEQSNNIVIIE